MENKAWDPSNIIIFPKRDSPLWEKVSKKVLELTPNDRHKKLIETIQENDTFLLTPLNEACDITNNVRPDPNCVAEQLFHPTNKKCESHGQCCWNCASHFKYLYTITDRKLECEVIYDDMKDLLDDYELALKEQKNPTDSVFATKLPMRLNDLVGFILELAEDSCLNGTNIPYNIYWRRSYFEDFPNELEQSKKKRKLEDREDEEDQDDEENQDEEDEDDEDEEEDDEDEEDNNTKVIKRMLS